MTMVPIEFDLRDGGRIRVEPRVPGFLMVPLAGETRDSYRWSRHVYLRHEGEDAILDSAMAQARLRGSPELIARLFSTGEPLELLAAAGLMIRGEEDARWEFHDLLFHQQSSRCDPLRSYGATWRMSGVLDPPAPRLRPESPFICLPAPEIDWVRDDSYAAVVTRRRSTGTHGDTPLTLGDVSRFLALATLRLPSAGGLNELTFYVAAESGCEGLAPGLHLYDPAAHALARAAGNAAQIVERARLAWATGSYTPQMLVLIAARVPVQAWKYEGIAYRNTLLDCGIALEAMYLAASALELGGCALGWNEPALLQALTGIAMQEETAMAAFVVGTQAGLLRRRDQSTF